MPGLSGRAWLACWLSSVSCAVRMPRASPTATITMGAPQCMREPFTVLCGCRLASEPHCAVTWALRLKVFTLCRPRARSSMAAPERSLSCSGMAVSRNSRRFSTMRRSSPLPVSTSQLSTQALWISGPISVCGPARLSATLWAVRLR